MNTSRMLILGVAALAAGAAALLARGLLGGGTAKVESRFAAAASRDRRSAGRRERSAAGRAADRRRACAGRNGRNLPSIRASSRMTRRPISIASCRAPLSRAPLVAGEPLIDDEDRARRQRRLHGCECPRRACAPFRSASRRSPAPAASSCRTTASMCMVTSQISETPRRFGARDVPARRARARRRPDL